MRNTRDHPASRSLLWFGQVIVAAVAAVVLLLPSPVAEANVIDKIKEIYQIPGNVDNLQKQYEATKQQYEQAQKQIEETQKQVEAQKQQLSDAMKKAQETEDLLTSQNGRLQLENDALQLRLQTMEKATQLKDKRLRQIKYSGIIIAVLIVLYFLSGRMFRIAIWRRKNKLNHHQ